MNIYSVIYVKYTSQRYEVNSKTLIFCRYHFHDAAALKSIFVYLTLFQHCIIIPTVWTARMLKGR